MRTVHPWCGTAEREQNAGVDCATVDFKNAQEIDEAISNTNLGCVSYRDIYYAPRGF